MVSIEVAQHFDPSTRQILELQSTGVFSKGTTLDEARLAYISRLREQAAGRAATNGLDLASERVRLVRLQADKLEAELAAKRCQSTSKNYQLSTSKSFQLREGTT